MRCFEVWKPAAWRCVGACRPRSDEQAATLLARGERRKCLEMEPREAWTDAGRKRDAMMLDALCGRCGRCG